MRAKFYTLLLLLVFLITCPCSMALAGEKEHPGATFRLPVYWVSRPGPDAAESRRQISRNRSLVYQMESKGQGLEKNKVGALWHL
jgi:hypothetical protein